MNSSAIDSAQESLRILRRIHCHFTDGTQKSGSGFCGPEPGIVLTCAHVVAEPGKNIQKVLVNGEVASLESLHRDIDLAVLSCGETEICQVDDSLHVQVGEQLVFSGFPTGVLGPSVFSGILSAHGNNLCKFPRCRLLQINGMINLGNSGGPVLRAGSVSVVGVITAKYVPLLQEIDKLRDILSTMPQFPSEVGLGKIDFATFKD